MHKTPLQFASVFSAFGLRVHACAGKSGSAMRPALLQSYRDANPRCSFSVPVCKPLVWKILLRLIPLVACDTLEMQDDDVVLDDVDGLHQLSVLSLSLSGEFYFH